jgi:hypothetical protein
MILLLRPEAENDLATARDWYDRKRSGLGDEFLDEVARAMIILESHPPQPRLYYRNFRRILLRRSPTKYSTKSSANASSYSVYCTPRRIINGVCPDSIKD